MKNQYFQKMQRNGITYRKQISPYPINQFNRLYSEGASLAFMYWAISERYHATDIYIDELPDLDITRELLDTFRAAGIKTFVISKDIKSSIADLEMLGCRFAGEGKVFRRETELYYGTLEIIKGYRLILC